jgi:hypothetical protein
MEEQMLKNDKEKESLRNNEEIFKYKRKDKQRHEKFEETKEE